MWRTACWCAVGLSDTVWGGLCAAYFHGSLTSPTVLALMLHLASAPLARALCACSLDALPSSHAARFSGRLTDEVRALCIVDSLSTARLALLSLVSTGGADSRGQGGGGGRGCCARGPARAVAAEAGPGRPGPRHGRRQERVAQEAARRLPGRRGAWSPLQCEPGPQLAGKWIGSVAVPGRNNRVRSVRPVRLAAPAPSLRPRSDCEMQFCGSLRPGLGLGETNFFSFLCARQAGPRPAPPCRSRANVSCRTPHLQHPNVPSESSKKHVLLVDLPNKHRGMLFTTLHLATV
jgi:hypothetical protein